MVLPGSSGLMHYRMRAYDPRIGQFLQPDPIGYSAGMNLFAYVGADPVNLVDPMGLCGNEGEPACRIGDVVVNGLVCRALFCTTEEIVAFLRSYLNDYETYPLEPWIVVRNGDVERVNSVAEEYSCNNGSTYVANRPPPDFNMGGVQLSAHLHSDGTFPFPGPSDGVIPRRYGIPNYGVSRNGIWVVMPGQRLSVDLIDGIWGIGPDGENFNRGRYERAINRGQGTTNSGAAVSCRVVGTYP